MRLSRPCLPLLLSSLLLSGAALADPTLDRILSTHQIQLGHWPGEVPFSFLDASKQPIGYAIDLCKRVVQDLAKKAGGPVSIHWVEVDGKTRFSLTDAGKVDLLCADTTNTRERQQKYGFSHTVFVAGTRILTDKAKGYHSVADLKGKAVAVIGSTTGEKLVSGLSRDKELNYRIVPAKGLDEAFALLEQGKVDGVGYDDILLADKAAHSKAGADNYVFLTEYLSVEPYGLMVRKGDTDLLKEVNRSLTDLFLSGEIIGIYNRWFVNSERKIPVGHILREDFKIPNNYPAYP